MGYLPLRYFLCAIWLDESLLEPLCPIRESVLFLYIKRDITHRWSNIFLILIEGTGVFNDTYFIFCIAHTENLMNEINEEK